MKKTIIALCLFLTVTVLLSGCSYSKLDDKIQHVLNGEKTTIINGYEVPVKDDENLEYISSDDVKYLEIGETIQDYVYFSSEDFGELEYGEKGLTYCLNKVTVYDSISDSGVDYNDLSGMINNEDAKLIRNNKFIIADMTADYNPPEDSKDLVNIGFSFIASNWNTDREFSFDDTIPMLVWFSLHPDENDEELDRDHNYFVFRMKPGDSVDFKVGIIAGESFVSDKDVYLALDGPEQRIEGFNRQYFKLISEKTEYANAEGSSQ